MKKIICALAVSALIGSAAFADVSINLNIRQRAAMYVNGDGKDNAHALMLDAYSGNGTDNMSISLSGDIVAFDSTWVLDEANTSYLRAKTLGAQLFLGNVTLFGGFWADGKLNGAYRTKSDVDAGNIEGMDFEYAKLGSAYKNSPSFFVDNYVMPVNVKGESYALGATYGLKFDTGAAAITGVLITDEQSDETAIIKDGSMQGHTGVLHIDARQDDLGQAEFVFKYGQTAWTKKDMTAVASDNATDLLPAMAFGLYVQPKTPLRSMILTVGGAGSMVDGNFTDYSANLRVRYQVIPKKLSVTSFHNYSALNDPEKNQKVTNETTKGIANSGISNDGKMGGTALKRDQIMSNNLMIRYNVNDTLSVFGIVADMIGMGDNMGNDAGDSIVQLRASLWAQFFAANNASVTTGLVYACHNFTEAKDAAGNETKSFTNWAIPVIIRVKF